MTALSTLSVSPFSPLLLSWHSSPLLPPPPLPPRPPVHLSSVKNRTERAERRNEVNVRCEKWGERVREWMLQENIKPHTPTPSPSIFLCACIISLSKCSSLRLLWQKALTQQLKEADPPSFWSEHHHSCVSGLWSLQCGALTGTCPTALRVNIVMEWI